MLNIRRKSISKALALKAQEIAHLIQPKLISNYFVFVHLKIGVSSVKVWWMRISILGDSTYLTLEGAVILIPFVIFNPIRNKKSIQEIKVEPPEI